MKKTFVLKVICILAITIFVSCSSLEGLLSTIIDGSSTSGGNIGSSTETVIKTDQNQPRNLEATTGQTQFSGGNVQANQNENSATVQNIDKALLRYSPESIRILDDVAKARRVTRKYLISTWYYPLGNDEMDTFFNTLDTAVHENTHMFTSLNMITSSGRLQEQYLIDGSIIRIQHGDQLIKTETVTGSLPARLRSFRWKTYVAPNADPSANQHGIYGLLNEFNAYYRGLKAVYECYPYLADIKGFEDSNVAIAYISALATDGSALGAFFEFKYWSLLYLLQLKEKNPTQYKEIINNQNFFKVFFYVHDHFEELVETMVPLRVDEFINNLNDNGVMASLEKRANEINFTIRYGSSARFVPLRNNAVNQIRSELKQTKYTSLLNELRP
jgi:hypothetical protein